MGFARGGVVARGGLAAEGATWAGATLAATDTTPVARQHHGRVRLSSPERTVMPQRLMICVTWSTLPQASLMLVMSACG